MADKIRKKWMDKTKQSVELMMALPKLELAYLAGIVDGEGTISNGRIFFEGSLRDRIMMTVKQCPQHTFLFLTKQPQNLIKFSPFPENCWVGVTATSYKMLLDALWELQDIQAKVKYLSLEPLLDWTHSEKEPNDHIGYIADWIRRAGISWLILGACTGTYSEMSQLVVRLYPDKKQQCYVCSMRIKKFGNRYTLQPDIEWVREIVEAADKAGIKVFLKDNLQPLLENDPLNPLYWANVCNDEAGNERVDDSLRQEMPTFTQKRYQPQTA